MWLFSLTVVWMEQKMCGESNRHQTPEPIHPRPVIGDFDEDVDNDGQSEVEDDVSLDDSSLAVTRS